MRDTASGRDVSGHCATRTTTTAADLPWDVWPTALCSHTTFLLCMVVVICLPIRVAAYTIDMQCTPCIMSAHYSVQIHTNNDVYIYIYIYGSRVKCPDVTLDNVQNFSVKTKGYIRSVAPWWEQCSCVYHPLGASLNSASVAVVNTEHNTICNVNHIL